MCGCEAVRPGGGATPYDEGREALVTGRRALLAGGAGIFFSAAAAGAANAAPESARTARRAYVIVLDGCIPGELDQGLTPHIKALRDGGLRYARASSMPVMETIPNHTMMMSGVRPDRTGVPANQVYDHSLGQVRTLERPADLRADTVIDRMRRQGFRTGTVLSKEYLYGIFGTRAGRRWEPAPIIPVSGHAPDQFTMRAATDMVTDYDPHLMFVNLGDIDRFGHSDFTGTSVQALRRTALADTDRLIGDFVALLKDRGTWRDTMLVVLADHSMDWSRPDRVVSLAGPLEEDPYLRGRVQIADNGGADLLYWTGPSSGREKAIARMRTMAEGVPGVHSVHDRRADWMRLGPEAGELVVFCDAGWRFSDPDPVTSNPIPGNHGHQATRSIPFFLGGGHPAVPRGRVTSAKAQTVDVAPTVAAFFGLSGRPRGGYDGRSRLL